MPAAQHIRLPAHVLDLGACALFGLDGQRVELRPQALDVLCLLAARAGQVVSKDELLQQVWPGLVVTDDSLVQAVCDARRALGDEAHRVIQTVPRRGYRLIVQVEGDAEPEPEPVAPQSPVAEVKAEAPAQAVPRRAVWRRWTTLGLLTVAALAGLALWAPWHDPAAVPALPLPAPDRPPIAVLDFSDADASSEERLMARAFSEELAGELSRNADLAIIAAHSSFEAMKGAGTPVQIAQRLHARYLVAGSVRREGETLRLAVQLLDGLSGRVVWSERRNVGAAELPAVRNALLERIAGSMHSSMRHIEETRVLQRPPASMDIYTMTLRAVSLKHRLTPQDSREAKALLERVVALDPQYAPGWLYLGMVNSIDDYMNLNGPFTVERMNEAIAQMEHAIALDDHYPAAYEGLAISYPWVGRFEDSVRAARRCLELGPSDAECMSRLAANLAESGQLDEAMVLLRRSMAMNPMPAKYEHWYYGVVFWISGQLEDALREFEEWLRLQPDLFGLRYFRILTLVELGRIEEARSETVALWQEMGRNMPPAERMTGAGWWFPNQAVIARKDAALHLAGWLTQQELAVRR